MTTPSNEQSLEGLIERVKAATGPDRHLDALIEVEARRQDAYRVGLDDNTRAYWQATIDGDVYDISTSYGSSRFTASIDAALALVERLLPGKDYEIQRDSDGWYFRIDEGGEKLGSALLPTLPLAILAALLTALASKEGARSGL